MVYEDVKLQNHFKMDITNIDRTHIIALKEVNGLLRNVELPITRPEQFIAELSAMIDNPNRTVWDMQSLFTTRFSKKAAYPDCIHPYSYSSSYVRGVHYPKLSEYNELKSLWAKAGKIARESYLASCKQNGKNPETTVAAKTEMEAINGIKKRQKQDFFNEAMRWIDAHCYYDTTNQLNRNGKVKMFSKESIGWNDFTYRVNDDIKVALKTNFGFGSAAYFLLAVQYKGLNILPYSYIVKYYKANMADIVRCTRSYTPCRESWSASFDFLSDFVNNSVTDPEGFVESYIMREVTEMIQGLEAIALNPKSFMERISNRTTDPCVIHVRSMFSEEKLRMQTYPDETPILFKVEKIIGALDFLKSLTAIAKEVSMVQPYINRLLELNLALYPEVKEAATKVRAKVEEQRAIKTNIETQISNFSEKLVPFDTEIKKLQAEAPKENPFKLSTYETAHPEYVKIKSAKNNLYSQLYKVNRRIDDFNSFLKILDRSLLKLDEIKQIKEAA